MARPRKEGLDYFPHDVTLSTDKKIEALRILHGNDGYAFYCIILENIYQEPSFELDVSDAETIQILAKKVEVTPEKFNEMLKTSIKHGCFDQERFLKDGVLTSNGIKKRAEVVVKKRAAMRNAHSKKVSEMVSDAETTADMPQSKVKVKVKESKDKYLKDMGDKSPEPTRSIFKPPTLEEVIAYCEERGNNVDAGKWYDFYASKGWMVGRNKMKDWKAAVRTWERETRPAAVVQRKETSFDVLQRMIRESEGHGSRGRVEVNHDLFG